MKPNLALRAVLLLAGIAVFTSCSKQAKESEPVVAVQTAVAQRQPIQQVISAEAILFARNQAAITPKLSAPVRKFFVRRGSRVHRGQLLAILENRDLAAAVKENQGVYEQAQATYSTATAASLPEELQKAELDEKSAKEALDAQQKLYDSRQKLYQEGALPRKELDQSAVALVQARAQYQLAEQHLAAVRAVGNPQGKKSAAGQLSSAQGKYEGAAAQLAFSEIRSPIDGVVTDRPVYPGETPAGGTPLLTIMDTSSVIAKAHIAQEQAAALKPEDAAFILAPGDVRVDGKVTLVSPAVDPNSTTVEVWVEAPNPEGRLRPGSTVRIEAVARAVKDAIVVPAAAVLKTAEAGPTVMVVGSDERAHQTAVETGVQEENRVQVTKGLHGGEKVIVAGAYGLPDNTRVKASEPAKAAASGDAEAAAGKKD